MKYFSIFLLLSILLAACGATPQPIVTPSPTPTSLPTSTTEWCQPAPAQSTSIPDAVSLFAPVSSSDWITGPLTAPVTMIVYNDFQCVECNDKLLTDLLAKHPNDLRLVYRPFPQPDRYDKALLAAQAAEAAGTQGKFWEMHNLLFEKQADWIAITPEKFSAWLGAQAELIGLDRVRFESDLTSPAIVAKIQKDMEIGKAAGIPVLPLILINGQVYYAPKDEFAFDQVIRLTALSARQFTACPAMETDPGKQYLATIQTTQGNIIVELFADKAPYTVNSFVFLARHGWFDGLAFQKINPGLLTGDPSGTGLGGPGYIFSNEIDTSLHFDKPGMVAMLNSGPDANGSLFFITLSPQPNLDGNYTIFGHVLSGMDVLARIVPRDSSQGDLLPNGDTIITIVIEER